MKSLRTFIVVLLFLFPSTAFAGDAATIIFESGLVVKIQDGFRQIETAMMKLNRNSQDHNVVALSLNGGTFLLNVSEVVVLCRDECKPLTIKHQLAPKKK